MLTTIEQKLSAIKAINESKDTVDFDAQVASRIREVVHSIESITFTTQGNLYSLNNVPPPVILKMVDAMNEYFDQIRKDLIAQAEELMK